MAFEGIDVNEEGQIHAYIVDLRNLPYEERLHWKAYNEPPKAGITIVADKNKAVYLITSSVSHFTPIQPAVILTMAFRIDRVR
jgi:hypothetical protein